MSRVHALPALVLSALAVLALLPVPAAACSMVMRPPVCGGGVCTPGQLREMEQLRAIAYGRELSSAIAARESSPATDRSYDLARILMPNILPPVDFADGGSCGPEVADGFADEAVTAADFEAELRARFGLAVRIARLADFSLLRDDCNNEVRRGLAAYLRDVLPAEQIGALWAFLLPRAGAQVPADGAEPLRGGRLTRLDGATLGPDTAAEEDYIRRRKERAAHYLRHHDNGIAVMRAISQFLAIRVLPLRDRPAELCPAADAAMSALATDIGS